MNKRKIDRRDFIKGAAITGAGLALGGGVLYGRRVLADLLTGDQGAIDRAIRDHRLGQISDTDAQDTVAAYMTEGPVGPRVVQTRDTRATNWPYYGGMFDPWYGDYVDQSVVTEMVDEGVTRLTDTSTRRDAWAALIPNYTSGAVAIKVNFNNSYKVDMDRNYIDALPQPVNAVIAGLLEIGVAQPDIWIYDVTDGGHEGVITTRFKDKIVPHYPDVKYYAHKSDPWSADHPGEGSFHPTEKVTFNPPNPEYPIEDRPLCNPLVNAAYLINMPIMKTHGTAGITLGFKNHFGSIWLGFQDGFSQNLHYYTRTWSEIFTPDYNPLVEIYGQPSMFGRSIHDKTILTIGDALYGAFNNTHDVPLRWTIFGDDSPNSLFFSRDPVAIDCVMADILLSEGGAYGDYENYLRLAEEAGLGTYERGDCTDPTHPLYQQIEYIQVNLG